MTSGTQVCFTCLPKNSSRFELCVCDYSLPAYSVHGCPRWILFCETPEAHVDTSRHQTNLQPPRSGVDVVGTNQHLRLEAGVVVEPTNNRVR